MLVTARGAISRISVESEGVEFSEYPLHDFAMFNVLYLFTFFILLLLLLMFSLSIIDRGFFSSLAVARGEYRDLTAEL